MTIPKLPVKDLLLIAIGLVVGGFANDYLGFHTDSRKELQSIYSDEKKAAADVLSDLQKYSDVAVGASAVSVMTPSDRDQFRKHVQVLYQSAQYVSQKLPQAKPEFTAYGDSMLGVLNAGAKMTGPADAKGFVEAFAHFLDAKNKFDAKIEGATDRYFG